MIVGDRWYTKHKTSDKCPYSLTIDECARARVYLDKPVNLDDALCSANGDPVDNIMG